MSAIVITKMPPPNERDALLAQHTPPSSSTTGYDTVENGRLTAGHNIKISRRPSKALDRSEPLRDSLSLARFILICTGIWSANFIFAIQSTAIPTLAPSISSEFQHAELAAYLGSVFSLASVAVIPIYGVLMDTLGRSTAMNTACLFFGVGAVFCAVSPNIWALIAARAFAGLGGGGLLTVSSVIVTDLVPLRDRGFYQGIMMTIFGAGSMIGGPFCGWLADKYGWPWSFWVQLPVIALCSIITTTFLPTSRIPPTHSSLLSGLASLDWLGSALLLVSVTTLLLGFSFHTSFLLPWSSPIVWGNLVAAVILIGLFYRTEITVENPLVPMGLLRSKHRTAIMASGFFLSIGNQAFMFQVPVYFAVIMNTSTAQAGVILSVCGGLGLALGSLVAGHHIRRGGRYRILGVCSMIPAVIASVAAAMWTPKWPWWGYYLTVFPATFGYSIFLCCQLIALISAVDSKSMPKATALLYTVRTLGVTLGVSIGGSIQIGSLTSHLKHRFRDHPDRNEIIASILHSKAAIRNLPPHLQHLALKAYAWSISTVWLVCAGIAVLTIICALGIQEKEVHNGSTKAADGAVESSSRENPEDR